MASPDPRSWTPHTAQFTLKQWPRFADKGRMRVHSGNIQIARPPKLVLDTNHLINIAKLRKGQPLPRGQSPEAYSLIDQCIAQHFGLIFVQAAPLDWVDGNATEDSAREIAQVVDSAKLRYFFESDTSVYLREVLDECRRLHPGVTVPQFNILHLMSDGGSYEPAELKLASLIPGYFCEGAQQAFSKLLESGIMHIPITSVQAHVNEAILWKQKNPETYRKRVRGFKEMLSEDITGCEEYLADPESFHIAWIKGYLKADKVLVACNDGLRTEDAADILKGLDLRRCPSVSLYLKAHEHRMRAGHKPADNEVDDWFILPVVPYADLVLVDRGFREFIIRADRSLESKVFANAADAARALALTATLRGA
jgi:hypothetical protein